MAIFRRDDPQTSSPADRTPAAQRVEAAPTVTRIAAGSRFDGKLSGGTDVIVDGELGGEVDLGATLVIGAKGSVHAKVRARSARIGGELRGNVTLDERLEVLPGGVLEGNVKAPRVAIAEGGFFRGHVDMGSGTEEAPAAPSNRAKPAARPAAQSAAQSAD
jgi:cytoskeletal protein CcmA (bactofilin family)